MGAQKLDVEDSLMKREPLKSLALIIEFYTNSSVAKDSYGRPACWLTDDWHEFSWTSYAVGKDERLKQGSDRYIHSLGLGTICSTIRIIQKFRESTLHLPALHWPHPMSDQCRRTFLLDITPVVPVGSSILPLDIKAVGYSYSPFREMKAQGYLSWKTFQ